MDQSKLKNKLSGKDGNTQVGVTRKKHERYGEWQDRVRRMKFCMKVFQGCTMESAKKFAGITWSRLRKFNLIEEKEVLSRGIPTIIRIPNLTELNRVIQEK